jgi:hypothetical protein
LLTISATVFFLLLGGQSGYLLKHCCKAFGGEFHIVGPSKLALEAVGGKVEDVAFVGWD